MKAYRVLLAVALLVVPTANRAWAQQIVPDGRTATSLQTSGVITDVRTTTVSGNNAFNSFSKFDVGP